MEQETKEERRRRQNRESMARAYASPEGRERLKANNARTRATPEGKASSNAVASRWIAKNRVKVLLLAAKNRASKANKPFDLTIEQLEVLLKPMICSMTGLALVWGYEGEGKNPWSPSLDRIDCSLGYTIGNLRLVCWAYNLARSNWPDEVVIAMAKGLLANECS